MLPKIIVKPSFEIIQATLNKAVQTIVKMAESLPHWDHLTVMQHNPKNVSCNQHIIR